MPSLVEVAMELRDSGSPQQGERHDRRREGSAKETAFAELATELGHVSKACNIMDIPARGGSAR